MTLQENSRYPMIQKLTARQLPARTQAPCAIVLHGSGDTNLNAVLRFYDDVDGYQPHFLIGYDGAVYQTAPEDRIAYHCAIKPAERDAYSFGFAYWSKRRWDEDRNDSVGISGFFPGYQDWIDRWRPDLESPLALVTGAHPNNVSLGIECLSPTDDVKTANIFTDDQYASLSELLDVLCQRWSIPRDKEHVLGHSDCSPFRRCTSKGPFDPGLAFNWARVLG